MASVVELFDSGTGDYVSDREGVEASRLFKVVVNTPDTGKRDDPADWVLRNPASAYAGRDAVPVGRQHPGGHAKDRAGLYSYRYTVEEHLAPQTYRVRVDYAEPAVFDFGRSSWSFSFSPGFGTRRATKITATEHPVTGVPFNNPVDVVIGPNDYEPNAEGPFFAHHAGVAERFTQTGKRRIEGADVTFPTGTMTLSRNLREYPSYTHSALLALRNKINSDTFLTRPPGTLKFVGPTVSVSAGLVAGGDRSGAVWSVQLNFEDNDEGWFVTIQDTHTNDKGETVAIVDAEARIQFSRYKYYRDCSFGGELLGIVNPYA